MSHVPLASPRHLTSWAVVATGRSRRKFKEVGGRCQLSLVFNSRWYLQLGGAKQDSQAASRGVLHRGNEPLAFPSLMNALDQL